jgi:4-hydroxybenzoyl-CoA thioesterase
MAPLTITNTVRIAWSQCDPAGIVFYPRYYEIFDDCTILLIEQAGGMKTFELLRAYDFAGFPMVDIRARFLRPTRYGDEVVIETAATEIRHSSFDIHHRLSKQGELAVECFETRVWIGHDPKDPEQIKSKLMPAEIVQRLTQA